jgi:hypothetical protein
MGPFEADHSDASDLGVAMATLRLAESIVGVLLGFAVGQGCRHRNLLQ